MHAAPNYLAAQSARRTHTQLPVLALGSATVLLTPALGRLVPQMAKHTPCLSRSILQMPARCLWEASLEQAFLSKVSFWLGKAPKPFPRHCDICSSAFSKCHFKAASCSSRNWLWQWFSKSPFPIETWWWREKPNPRTRNGCMCCSCPVCRRHSKWESWHQLKKKAGCSGRLCLPMLLQLHLYLLPSHPSPPIGHFSIIWKLSQ